MGEGHLESKEQEEGLDTVEATVDKVAHEEVVGVRAVPTDFEELLQIIKLPVNISTYLESTSLSGAASRAD